MTAVARVEQPTLVVLTDGPENAAYWEHRWEAECLGVALAEPDELELRGARLHHGDEPVDVVYRRTPPSPARRTRSTSRPAARMPTPSTATSAGCCTRRSERWAWSMRSAPA